MERRHVQFALIAFAIIFGSQLLQIWLFPRPPAEPGDAELPFAAAKQEAGAEGAFRAADKPAESAVRMALEMRDAFPPIGESWKKRGYDLGLGCGVAQGYATLGAIGFEGRWDYAAIGNVTNLAARLCSEAAAGQVLVDRKIMAKLDGQVEATDVGPLNLKGIAQPVPAFSVVGFKPPG